MEERLVDFKTAKLAKAKGFNENCHYHYSYGNGDKSEPINGQVYVGGFVDRFGSNRKYKNSELANWDLPYGEFSASTQSFLQTWLRDTHNIDVYVLPYNKNLNPCYEVIVNNVTYSGYTSYEEALERGLKEGLELVNIWFEVFVTYEDEDDEKGYGGTETLESFDTEEEAQDFISNYINDEEEFPKGILAYDKWTLKDGSNKKID